MLFHSDDEACIQQTRRWVKDVIVAHNFCPFAGREVERDSIRYTVCSESKVPAALEALIEECIQLDNNSNIETALVIYPQGFEVFEDYLDFAALAEALLVEQDYEGIYQLATFHPDYLFADSSEDEPANYTNRSPHPVLHILREASLEKAIDSHPDPEGIPEHNISCARELGLSVLCEQFNKLDKD